MKKKFLAMYALAGVLVASPVFTSCVDNEESPSVTQLRNAKAEQLKAAATLAQAQAQAATVQAEAYAALQNAQAEYYKAQAENQKAQADQKVQQTEQAAQEFAVRIETIKAQAQLELMQIQQQIESQKNNIADAEYNRINQLLNQYNNALNTLTNYKNELIRNKANLALLEADVLSAEAWNNKSALSTKQYIEKAKARLAIYKENLNLDNATLVAKVEAAHAEFELAGKKFKASEEPSKLVAANELVIEKNEEMDELRNIINSLNSQYNLVEFEWGGIDFRINSNYGYSESWNTYYYNYFCNIRINETNKLNATRQYAADVEYWAEQLGKADDTKDKETAYGRLAAANDQMTTAKAMPETTDDEKAAKKQAIADAETSIANATDDLARYQKWYNDAVERQTEFTEALAAFDVEAANKLADEMVAANEANELAWEAWEKAYETVNEAYEEYNALWNLAWEAGDNINEEIATLEAQIAEWEKDLVRYERNTAEETLAMAKEQIAQLEDKIAIQEKLVADRKAELDALLAEETPAE